ncbi:MAG: serine hydrolase domain-containing protein [Myxococcota bacterium]
MRALLPLLLIACGPSLDRGEPETRPEGAIPVQRGIVLDEALADAFDEAIAPVLAESGVGLGVAVVKDGVVVYTAGYGWADLASERPLEASTPMQVASVSKTLIAVSAMQGVEAGRFSLDTPVADVLGFPVDNPRVDGDVIQLQQVLMHMSGIEDSKVYGGSYHSGDPAIGLLDFVQSYVTPDTEHYHKTNFSKRAPGEGFAYSNVGASLGALAIAQAEGMEYADLVKRDIFEPLGMESSGFFRDDLPVAPATNYAGRNRAWEPYGFPTYPDGLWRASPDDLGKFMAAIQGNTLLSEASTKQMLTVDPTIEGDEDGQALGWAQVGLVEGRVLMGHTGGDPGVGAFMALDLESGVGVAFVLNSWDIELEVGGVAYSRAFDLAETAETGGE